MTEVVKHFGDLVLAPGRIQKGSRTWNPSQIREYGMGRGSGAISITLGVICIGLGALLIGSPDARPSGIAALMVGAVPLVLGISSKSQHVVWIQTGLHPEEIYSSVNVAETQEVYAAVSSIISMTRE